MDKSIVVRSVQKYNYAQIRKKNLLILRQTVRHWNSSEDRKSDIIKHKGHQGSTKNTKQKRRQRLTLCPLCCLGVLCANKMSLWFFVVLLRKPSQGNFAKASGTRFTNILLKKAKRPPPSRPTLVEVNTVIFCRGK